MSDTPKTDALAAQVEHEGPIDRAASYYELACELESRLAAAQSAMRELDEAAAELQAVEEGENERDLARIEQRYERAWQTARAFLAGTG